MLLAQLLENRMNHALKYGGDTPADVVVRQLGDRRLLAVRDRGLVAPTWRGRIFAAFQRGEPAAALAQPRSGQSRVPVAAGPAAGAPGCRRPWPNTMNLSVPRWVSSDWSLASGSTRPRQAAACGPPAPAHDVAVHLQLPGDGAHAPMATSRRRAGAGSARPDRGVGHGASPGSASADRDAGRGAGSPGAPGRTAQRRSRPTVSRSWAGPHHGRRPVAWGAATSAPGVTLKEVVTAAQLGDASAAALRPVGRAGGAGGAGRLVDPRPDVAAQVVQAVDAGRRLRHPGGAARCSVQAASSHCGSEGPPAAAPRAESLRFVEADVHRRLVVQGRRLAERAPPGPAWLGGPTCLVDLAAALAFSAASCRWCRHGDGTAPP